MPHHTTSRILPACAVATAVVTAAVVTAGAAFAATVHASLQLATPTGPGADVGTATITDSPRGARIKLDLHGLPAGRRGLHVHEHGSCDVAAGNDGKPVPAGAAGGHFDPARADTHRGPTGHGHLGDLPSVAVGRDGTTRASLTAPRIRDVSMLKGKALMLHVGGDTYADTPPLGGGGDRLACGVLD